MLCHSYNMALEKNMKVWIVDFPFGRPLKTRGKIVGKVGSDYYNVLIESGLMEGNIVKYKYWRLQPQSDINIDNKGAD